MRTFRYTEHIARPRDEVFAYMTDFSNASRWRNLVRSMELLGSGPIREGSQVLVTMDVMGEPREAVSEVSVYDPPRRYSQRNTANGFTGTFEYELEPDSSGTTVTFSCDLRTRGFRWLALPLVIRSHRVRYRNQLKVLKASIERNPLHP